VVAAWFWSQVFAWLIFENAVASVKRKSLLLFIWGLLDLSVYPK